MICFNECVLIGQFVLSVAFLGSLILIFLFMLLLHLTLVRRALKTYPKIRYTIHFTICIFGLWRPIIFAYASVIPFYNNLPQFRQAYGDMDISAFANRVEKAIAYCLIISGIIFICAGALFLITGWLDIYT